MGKTIRKHAIQRRDLIEFLDSNSDFDFELRTLKLLRQHGLDCAHGGHYEDSLTKKSRQFDLRAMQTRSTPACKNRVRLAVECKNIGESFPVLIHCTPRQESESFYDLALVRDTPESSGNVFAMPALESRATRIRMKGVYSIYKPGLMVGKGTAQVGRSLDGEFVSNDSEIFDKWSQCLSSASDLVDEINMDGEEEKDAIYLSMVIPIVVIPDERLWVVEYDRDGQRLSDPSKADRCSCFVGKDYKLGNPMAYKVLTVSHIEIMTFSGFERFIKRWLCCDTGRSELFPLEAVYEATQEADVE